jgi:uncharacterized protein YxjI
MQQVTAFMTNDFAITDPAGTAVGHIHTGGDGASRFFLGSRELDVYDADGSALLHVSDPVDFLQDTFELSHPDGRPLAHAVKRFTLLRTAVDVDVVGGPRLELQGDLLGYDFQILAGDTVAATVSRQWAGISKALLGHSRYVVGIRSDAPRDIRAAVIGSCLILDLIRAKQANNG